MYPNPEVDAGLEVALRRDECDATDAGDRATEDHVDVTNAHDVDADRGRGVRVFAHRAHVQAVTGLEQREADHRDQHDHEVEESRLVEEDRTEHGDLGEER